MQTGLSSSVRFANGTAHGLDADLQGLYSAGQVLTDRAPKFGDAIQQVQCLPAVAARVRQLFAQALPFGRRVSMVFLVFDAITITKVLELRVYAGPQGRISRQARDIQLPSNGGLVGQ